MNTFEYPVPTRVALNNGVNVIRSTVLLSNDVNSTKYNVMTRNEQMLRIKDEADHEELIHIDMCWVLLNVNI